MTADAAETVVDGPSPVFIELLVALREQYALGRIADARDQLIALDEMCETPFDRARLNGLKIMIGTDSGDASMARDGLVQLRDASPTAGLTTLAELSDLSYLGSRAMRAELVCKFLGPSPDVPEIARELLTGSWVTPQELVLSVSTLPRSIRAEIVRMMSWLALEDALRCNLEGNAFYASLSEFVPAPVDWEVQLAQTLWLAHDRGPETALPRLRRLATQRNGLPTQRSVLSEALLRYGPVGMHSTPWREEVRGICIAAEPGSAVEAAHKVLMVQGVLSALSEKQTESLLDQSVLHPGHYLVSPAGANPARRDRFLSALVVDPVPPSRWPWKSRTTLLVDAMASWSDDGEALSLLALSRMYTGDPVAADRALKRLQRVDHGQVVRMLDAGQLTWLGSTHQPEWLTAAERRKCVYRVVLDANNVGSGNARRQGEKASLARVHTAVKALEAAGFEDIFIFFDAHSGAWTADDWRRIGREREDERFVVCDGAADPVVLECFLKDPQGSWFVTRDRYRDWTRSLTRWRPNYAEHRLGITWVSDEPVWSLDLRTGARRA